MFIMRVLPCLVVVLLYGSNDAAFELLERLSGMKDNVVVLASTPMALGEPAVKFQVSGDAVVLGNYAAVYAVLPGDVSLQAREVMNTEHDRIRDGVEFKATVSTQSDDTVRRTWSNIYDSTYEPDRKGIRRCFSFPIKYQS